MRSGILALAAATALATSAHGAEDEFFKGKQLQIVCSTENVGIYDTYSRLLARHMPRHIPGNPLAIVLNMPGGGSIKAANYLANVAPRDGTVLLGSHSAISTLQLTAPDQAKFDVNAFNWIGSITKDPFVAYVWNTAPVRSLADLKTTPTIMGATSAGSAGVDMAILANEMFGYKIKLIAGYKDTQEVKLAMERSEIQGTFANSWGDLKAQSMPWVAEGKVRVIGQHGFAPHPELKDVAMFMDEAKNEADRQALVFMLARQEASKPYFAPPGVPEARIATLRAAFDATMRDPAFIQDAKTMHMAVEQPMNGEELTQVVRSVSSTPKTVVDRVQGILANARASGK